MLARREMEQTLGKGIPKRTPWKRAVHISAPVAHQVRYAALGGCLEHPTHQWEAALAHSSPVHPVKRTGAKPMNTRLMHRRKFLTQRRLFVKLAHSFPFTRAEVPRAYQLEGAMWAARVIKREISSRSGPGGRAKDRGVSSTTLEQTMRLPSTGGGAR